MKTLYIDTHLWDIIIILFSDGKIKQKKEVINKKNNSKFIFPAIVEVLGDEKIDNIIVVNGPGSFTGVRLGVTIAKTFAYTLGIPIRAISSLECLAISSSKKSVAIDDNNGYYVGYFNEDNTIKSNYVYLSKKNECDLSKITLSDDIKLDYLKIYDFVLKNKKNINPHEVFPLYVKKLELNCDKECKN